MVVDGSSVFGMWTEMLAVGRRLLLHRALGKQASRIHDSLMQLPAARRRYPQ